HNRKPKSELNVTVGRVRHRQFLEQRLRLRKLSFMQQLKRPGSIVVWSLLRKTRWSSEQDRCERYAKNSYVFDGWQCVVRSHGVLQLRFHDISLAASRIAV